MCEENIKFFFSENENENENENNNGLLSNFTLKNSQMEKDYDIDAHIVNYNLNYTIKELMLICSYYGIAQIIKTNKCNKEEMILALVTFENDIKNQEIVLRRKNMWFYINELKNDKFMKKYILL
jgi:hypothetical protein